MLQIDQWISFPVDTWRKLNVHKTFRRCPGRLLNVLCTFNLRPVLRFKYFQNQLKIFWEKHPFAIYIAYFCCSFGSSIYFAGNKCYSQMDIHSICPLQYCYCLKITIHWMRDSILLMQEITVELSDKSFICALTELVKPFEVKSTALKVHANWKSTNKWTLMCFKNILKISHSNYLKFCTNLPVKLAVFLKSSLLFNSFYCLFCL